MRRAALVGLQDILAAIDAVIAMTDGVGLGAYRSDIKLRFAVERGVEIIFEASRHVPGASKALFPDVPWAEIAATGNRLRREY
jgi:uncharacterized protein with HEPN domain